MDNKSEVKSGGMSLLKEKSPMQKMLEEEQSKGAADSSDLELKMNKKSAAQSGAQAQEQDDQEEEMFLFEMDDEPEVAADSPSSSFKASAAVKKPNEVGKGR